MNPKLDLFFARRSVRKYRKEPIPEETIKDLLEAAMAAPSAMAKDPWHFIVVRDQAGREKVAEGLPYGKMLKEAGAAIVVCGDLDKAHDRQMSYLMQDCCAAVENLLLAATALGLGTVWLGVQPREDRVNHLRGLFNLPANIVPVCVISVGWPAESPKARTRFKKSLVHRETW